MSLLRPQTIRHLVPNLFDEARRALMSREDRAVLDEIGLAAVILAGLEPQTRRAAVAALVALERQAEEAAPRDVFLVD